VQAGRALDANRVTELGDDCDLAALDGEEAEGDESQSEQAESDERADTALAERDPLLSAPSAPVTTPG
jgi:hypothetical protein